MKRGARRHFALHLRHAAAVVYEAEHGLLLETPPLALRQGKQWQFGVQAPQAQHLLEDVGFPIKAYLHWLLERFYTLKKIDLLLLTPNQQRLSHSLWFELLQDLGLAAYTLASPLDCLRCTLKTGLLLYLEDGLASLAVCQQGQLLDAASVGYGHYLTRALRHQVWQQHGLYIEGKAAAQVWKKLLAGSQQVTVSGENAEGQRRNQMLIQEDLGPLVSLALHPLVDEILHLQTLFPGMDCFMLGGDARHPHLQAAIRQHLQANTAQNVIVPENGERLLQNSIQRVLQENQP